MLGVLLHLFVVGNQLLVHTLAGQLDSLEYLVAGADQVALCLLGQGVVLLDLLVGQLALQLVIDIDVLLVGEGLLYELVVGVDFLQYPVDFGID